MRESDNMCVQCTPAHYIPVYKPLLQKHQRIRVGSSCATKQSCTCQCVCVRAREHRGPKQGPTTEQHFPVESGNREDDRERNKHMAVNEAWRHSVNRKDTEWMCRATRIVDDPCRTWEIITEKALSWTRCRSRYGHGDGATSVREL